MPGTDNTPPDLPRDKAPDSPNIRTWNRRVLGWGCAPAMTLGLVAGFLPGWGERLALVGTGLAVLMAGPIAVHTWRLRRENQARYDAARAEAAERGRRVRVVEREGGDHEYEIYAMERWEPDEWDLDPPGEGSDKSSDADSSTSIN